MTEWAIALMAQGGYAGIAALMFLENVFPPIPSEIVMPIAGAAARRGELDFAMVVLAGAVGSVAGAVFWYLVGRRLGVDRLKRFADRRGRLLTLSPREIDAADRWFDRHGGKAVFLGRLVPAVRTFISVPAGVAAMAPGPFLAWTTAGTALWTALLAGAGWLAAGAPEAVADYFGPVSNVVVGGLLAYYVYRVVTFRRR